MSDNSPLTVNKFPEHVPVSLHSYFEVVPLSKYLKFHSEMVIKPHTHGFFQIIWFKSGIGTHQVDFHSYDVIDHSIFLIGKDQVHSFDRHADYEGFVLNFSEDFIVQKDSDVDFFLKCSMFNNPFQRPSCCVGSGSEYKLDEYIVQIQTELEHNDPFGHEELLRFYLKAFLIQVQRRKLEIERTTTDKGPFVIDDKKNMMIRFVNLVEENYNKGLTVTEYAELLHISNRTLSDLTQQLVRKRPSSIIQDRIILEAKRLLLHSSLNINEIGHRLGFSDNSYFVKYFRKNTEMTPSKFRNSLQ